MTLFFKQTKFPTLLFVAASLAALIMTPLLLLFFRSIVVSRSANDEQETKSFYSRTATCEEASDPFITKTPAFRKALRENGCSLDLE